MQTTVSPGSALFVTLILLLPGTAALAAGNAPAGAMIFEELCAECHSTTGKNKKGPSLRGIVGRMAGRAQGFADYSDGMKNSGLVWTAEQLDRYLTKPDQFIPRVKMTFKGLSDARERAELIEFLSTRK